MASREPTNLKSTAAASFSWDSLHRYNEIVFDRMRAAGLATHFPLMCTVLYSGAVDPVAAAAQGIVVTRDDPVQPNKVCFYCNHHTSDMTHFLYLVRGLLDPRGVVPSSWPDTNHYGSNNALGYMVLLPQQELARLHNPARGSRKVCLFEALFKLLNENMGYQCLELAQDVRKFYGLGPSYSGNVMRLVEYDGSTALSELLLRASPAAPAAQAPAANASERKIFFLTDWDHCLMISDMFHRVMWLAMVLPRPLVEAENLGFYCYTNSRSEYVIQLVGNLSQQPAIARLIAASMGGLVVNPSSEHIGLLH
jgi:hypothetical protein